LVGPNGAGKTTLVDPTSGSIQVLGLNPAQHRKTIKAKVGLLSPFFELPSSLTRYQALRVYAGYYAVSLSRALKDPRLEAYCWSHLRRKFYEIAAGGHAPIAAEALWRIGQLYEIEAESPRRSATGSSTGMGSAASSTTGASRSIPRPSSAPSAPSPSTARTRCSLAMTRERELGHARVADRDVNDVDPLAWITDVLTKLVNLWPASRIDELMPWAYVRPAPAAVKVG
jgi:transposase